MSYETRLPCVSECLTIEGDQESIDAIYDILCQESIKYDKDSNKLVIQRGRFMYDLYLYNNTLLRLSKQYPKLTINYSRNENDGDADIEVIFRNGVEE